MISPQQNDPLSGASRAPETVLVWDLAVRVFHWALIASILAAYLTSDGLGKVHRLAGYTAVGLLAFRIVWGFAGTKHARFADFVRSPVSVLAYIRDILHGHATRSLGHNPAGGAMILALLVVVAGIGATGLMMESTRFFGVAWVETIHKSLVYSLFALVPLHVIGVILAGRSHHENLTVSMITGRKPARGTQGEEEARRRELDTRLWASNGLALAALVAVLVTLGWPQIRAQLDVLEKRRAVAAAVTSGKGAVVETASATVQTTSAVATAPTAAKTIATTPLSVTIARRQASETEVPSEAPSVAMTPIRASKEEAHGQVVAAPTEHEPARAETTDPVLSVAGQSALREVASATRPAAQAISDSALVVASVPEDVSTATASLPVTEPRKSSRAQSSKRKTAARTRNQATRVTSTAPKPRHVQMHYRAPSRRTRLLAAKPSPLVEKKAIAHALARRDPKAATSRFLIASTKKAGKGQGRGRGKGRGGSSGKDRSGGSSRHGSSNSGRGSNSSGKGSSGSSGGGSGGSSGKGSGGRSSGSGGGHGSSGSGGD